MIKIVHIMADGSVRDDIKGVKVPFTPETEGAYRILANLHKDKKQPSTGS